MCLGYWGGVEGGGGWCYLKKPEVPLVPRNLKVGQCLRDKALQQQNSIGE